MIMRILSVASILGLAGCDALPVFNAEAPPVQQAALLGGAVTIAGPDGYCVDVTDSRLSRGFALLAPCQTLGLTDISAVSSPAVLTVQAGSAGTASVSGSEPAFAGLLETDAGATLLSRSGQADGVSVLDTQSSANAVFVVFDDKAGTPIEGTQNREWRAFVDVNGRLVTISLRGLASAPLGQEQGLTLLKSAVDAVTGANAA